MKALTENDCLTNDDCRDIKICREKYNSKRDEKCIQKCQEKGR